MKSSGFVRMIMMVVGIILIGIAVGFFRISSFGTDPFTTMNLGVSGFLGMPFGVYQLMVNIVLFVFVWFYARKNIGAGTIVNMVFVGFIADFVVNTYNLAFTEPTMMLRIILMVIAVVICSVAVAFYMTADLGIAPYDAMAVMIEKVTNKKIPFAWARILTDVTCVIIGFSFGAIVGISTLITAFFTGPLVQFSRTRLAEPLLKMCAEPKGHVKLKRRVS